MEIYEKIAAVRTTEPCTKTGSTRGLDAAGMQAEPALYKEVLRCVAVLRL